MSIDVFNYPYESPLEEIFAINIIKYLNNSADLKTQFEVKTICGRFRIDFIIEYCSKIIAFECDGMEYHDEWRDEWRDAMILGVKAVDIIYRLRGPDLYHRLEDCFYIISKLNPEIFSDRGLLNIEQLASETVKNTIIDEDKTLVMTIYRKESKSLYYPPFIFITRRLLKLSKGRRYFWKTIYNYAKKQGGGNLDKIIKKYQNEKFN